MSEKTKPIKRNPALVEFSRDHHFGLLLVWKIRQGQRTGIKPVRIGKYISFFYQEDLAHHFADEETWLFPKLPADDPQRLRAEREHLEVRSLVNSISQDSSDPQLQTRFADLLEAHIRFEERELFNELQDRMSEEQLLRLLKEVPARPHPEEGAWKDEFWQRK